jgi:hypothetical protein
VIFFHIFLLKLFFVGEVLANWASGCCSTSGRISLDALDEARKSFGTDEDILLVCICSNLLFRM